MVSWLILPLIALGMAAAGTPPPATPREMTSRAHDLVASGDLQGALALMASARRAMTDSEPLDRELAESLAAELYNLGVRFNNQKRALEAMQSFTEALQLNRAARGIRDASFRGTLKDAAMQVARYLVASGQAETALDACRLLAEGPPDAEALTLLGDALLARRDAASALRAYEAAGEAAPGQAAPLAGQGKALRQGVRRALESNDLAEAVRLAETAAASLAKAAEIEPRAASRRADLAEALAELAAARGRAGDLAASAASREDAEATFRQAAELDSASPWHEMNLAMFLFNGLRYQEAVEHFQRAVERFERLLAASPAAREAASWKSGRDASAGNRTASLYNLAVDALNRAQFDRAEALIALVEKAGGRWAGMGSSFRAAMAPRAAAFRQKVAAHEQALARDPALASELLYLGDLYALVGDYDKAIGYYGRLRAIAADTPGLADRITAVTDPGPLAEIMLLVEPPGGRVKITFFNPALKGDLDLAVKAAWLRITSSLGDASMRGDLAITIYPTRRVFREKAGRRVGGMVKGFYAEGRISLFETPSHSAVEWVSSLTHEMAHHAVERLSGGRAPRWFSEGMARYVEGDSALVDRARLAGRLREGSVPQLAALDETMQRSWNDPDTYIDGRDASLLAVEELARRLGPSGLGLVLGRLKQAGADDQRSLEGALAMTLAQLDTAWRAGLNGGP